MKLLDAVLAEGGGDIFRKQIQIKAPGGQVFGGGKIPGKAAHQEIVDNLIRGFQGAAHLVHHHLGQGFPVIQIHLQDEVVFLLLPWQIQAEGPIGLSKELDQQAGFLFQKIDLGTPQAADEGLLHDGQLRHVVAVDGFIGFKAVFLGIIIIILVHGGKAVPGLQLPINIEPYHPHEPGIGDKGREKPPVLDRGWGGETSDDYF